MKSFAAAVLCTLLTACAQTLTVTERDDGRTLSVARGTKVAVVLPENPSTGYSWEFFFFPHNQTALADAAAKYAAPDTDLLGVPGTKEFSFTAAKTGVVTVTGYYYRPWEKLNEKTDKRVFFTFDVE